jgi:hypothetical protein
MDNSGSIRDRSSLYGFNRHVSLLDLPRDNEVFDRQWRVKTKRTYLFGLTRWFKVCRGNLINYPDKFRVLWIVFFGVYAAAVILYIEHQQN